MGCANISHPTEGSFVESLCSYSFWLQSNISLFGRVSATDGKVLSQEIRYHHPNFSAEKVKATEKRNKNGKQTAVNESASGARRPNFSAEKDGNFGKRVYKSWC